MAKEKIIDNLCALAVGRYRRENPRTKVTMELRKSIHASVSGVFERLGEVEAYKYAKTANLLA